MMQENSWTHIMMRRFTKTDPFAKLDQKGVGKLMEMATALGKEANLETSTLGICGEHGGDPSSVEFCYMSWD